mgnify:CR=1 FL=1|tara:strand:- start:249 stop:398 length:150 start_codon:yes stop_codon:yes gene_type:complete
MINNKVKSTAYLNIPELEITPKTQMFIENFNYQYLSDKQKKYINCKKTL